MPLLVFDSPCGVRADKLLYTPLGGRQAETEIRSGKCRFDMWPECCDWSELLAISKKFGQGVLPVGENSRVPLAKNPALWLQRIRWRLGLYHLATRSEMHI